MLAGLHCGAWALAYIQAAHFNTSSPLTACAEPAACWGRQVAPAYFLHSRCIWFDVDHAILHRSRWMSHPARPAPEHRLFACCPAVKPSPKGAVPEPPPASIPEQWDSSLQSLTALVVRVAEKDPPGAAPLQQRLMALQGACAVPQHLHHLRRHAARAALGAAVDQMPAVAASAMQVSLHVRDCSRLQHCPGVAQVSLAAGSPP